MTSNPMLTSTVVSSFALILDTVVEQITGRDHVLNHLSIPAACFTHPEISMVGLTEVNAKISQLHIEYECDIMLYLLYDQVSLKQLYTNNLHSLHPLRLSNKILILL